MAWRRWFVVVPLGSLILGCGAHGDASKSAEEEGEKKEPHVLVRTEPAKMGPLSESVGGLGRCEALPDHIATLTPAVEGHVHDLRVTQGQAVKKGQPIVELDKAVAQADLAEKAASRDSLKASLVLLKSLPRPEERKANELAVQQAKVAVARAQALVDSLEKLQTSNLTSKTQLYDARKALEAAELQEKSAEATLKAMMIGPRPEAVAEAESKIKTADALVAFSQAHLDYHTIQAPIDGVLDSLTCHPGQTIAIGSPIGEVVDTRQVFAAIWLPPRSVQSVKVGQEAHVWLADAKGLSPATASDDKSGMGGNVAFVGRVAHPQTGNLPIRVLVDNKDGRLTIGQSIRVTVTVHERKDRLQVPAEAILDLGEGPVLNVVRDGKSKTLHPEVGEAHEGWVAVSGTDLKPGEPVIVEGGYNLPEGTPVKPAEGKAVAQAEAAK
jgi:RND family efflux transporter MFP subunit